ncbi:hypothetical protein [Pseudomonas sp. FEN]|nr:hypothetical protein [Pseudomonas sp. FEN]
MQGQPKTREKLHKQGFYPYSLQQPGDRSGAFSTKKPLQAERLT